MINLQTVYILTAGMIGGIFSSWVLRLRKNIFPIFEKKINKKFYLSLSFLVETIIALIIVLIMYLMIQ
jgi:hypothetical protein